MYSCINKIFHTRKKVNLLGIGKRIKEAREHLGLTQSELADLVGVTGSAITNYEKETSHPRESVMYRLFEALEVDANYLFQDVANIPDNTIHITLFEFDRVKKYRLLDNYGKRIVDLLLEEEYRRCTETTASIPDISVYEDTENPQPVMRKESSPLSLPQEDLAAIKKTLEQPRVRKA